MAATLIHASFFELSAPGGLLGDAVPPADAVVGNPPFIRYQQFRGVERARARTAALRQGVRLSGLASSWAAMLVHAAAFLRPEGRLAMVLPAELLTVNYSQPVRRFLCSRFASVHVVQFRELVFDGVTEEVVLVPAEGSGGCASLQFHLVRNASELQDPALLGGSGVIPEVDGSKWTELALPRSVRSLFRDVVAEWAVPLETYGTPVLGTVTGANRFFALRPSQVRALGLRVSELTPISPPGTRHLQGLRFTARDWKALAERDVRVWLLTLPGTIGRDHPVRADTSYSR